MGGYCAAHSAAAAWRRQAPHRHACGGERPDVHPEHRLSVAPYIPKDFPPRSTVYNYFVWWQCDRVLDRIHHALYVECREGVERQASPTAAIIDSQSVKSAEKERAGAHRPAWLRCRQADQGQEAASSRRYARSPAPCRRRSGSRWRPAATCHAVREVSIPSEAVCRQRLSRSNFCRRARRNPAISQNRNHQTIRPRQGFRSIKNRHIARFGT